MIIKTWPIWCLFVLSACQSDADRLREAERRFLKILASPEKIALTAGKDTLFLPMLPAPEDAAKSKTEAAALQTYLQKIDKQSLAASDLKRLDALSRATADLAAQGVAVSLEQFSQQITTSFERALTLDNKPLTQKLMEYLPEYVAQLEQRWPAGTVGARREIVQAASDVYDLLAKLETLTPAHLKTPFARARRAWKDYIGLCQSGFLAGN